jgi:hypothetical protein
VHRLDLTIELRNKVAKAQILGIDPTTIKGIEGVLWSGFKRLIAAAKLKSEDGGMRSRVQRLAINTKLPELVVTSRYTRY